MDNPNIRLHRYFNGEMNAQEKSSFEQEVKENLALRKAFIVFGLRGDAPNITPESIRIRQEATERVEQMEPLPEPKITWRYYWLNFWYSPWRNWLTLGLVLILAISLLWPKKPDVPIASFLPEYFQEARCVVTQAGGSSAQINYVKASQIYCNGQPDEAALMALELDDSCTTGFCMSRYFLAHVQLENEKYPEAMESFNLCLKVFDSHIKDYPLIKNDKGKLTFNLLLAKLGAEQPLSKVKPELQDFIQSLDKRSQLYKTAKGLYSRLKAY